MQKCVAIYMRSSLEQDEDLRNINNPDESDTIANQREYLYMHAAVRGFVKAQIVEYVDEGISGTQMKHREQLLKLVEDCKAGKVDMIITKSISRFSRNVVDCLTMIRELKALSPPVEVYFEKERLSSLDDKTDMVLSLMASIAQEESRSISANISWAIRKRMENGTQKIPTACLPGYSSDEDGNLVIVEEEAEIVKYIYKNFIKGLHQNTIAERLNKKGSTMVMGNEWTGSSVRNILRNEKYCGDMLLQKKFRENFRTKKVRNNTGELRKVYVEGSHEGIIDRETFKAAQREMDQRSRKHKANSAIRKNAAHDGSERLFTGLIVCGECGGAFIHKFTNAGRYDKPVWICQKYFRYATAVCHAQKIPEEILIEKVREILGVTELTPELVREAITKIYVPEHYHLVFELVDGSIVDTVWEHPSRSLSWTEEMKQQARKRALKRYGKEATNDTEN